MATSIESTTSIDSTRHTLERLLRLELVASESYDTAIRRLAAPTQQVQLEELRRDHDVAVGCLRSLLATMHDATAPRGLRLIGTLARGIARAVGLLGSTTMLRALRSGERALLGRLEQFDRDLGLAPEARTLIEDQLVPRAREHVGALDRLLAAA